MQRFAEGGMVLFKDAKTADKCRLLVNHGMRERYYHEITGYNYRMSNICAGIGRGQMTVLDGHIARRREIHKIYKGR